MAKAHSLYIYNLHTGYSYFDQIVNSFPKKFTFSKKET